MHIYLNSRKNIRRNLKTYKIPKTKQKQKKKIIVVNINTVWFGDEIIIILYNACTLVNVSESYK